MVESIGELTYSVYLTPEAELDRHGRMQPPPGLGRYTTPCSLSSAFNRVVRWSLHKSKVSRVILGSTFIPFFLYLNWGSVQLHPSAPRNSLLPPPQNPPPDSSWPSAGDQPAMFLSLHM